MRFAGRLLTGDPKLPPVESQRDDRHRVGYDGQHSVGGRQVAHEDVQCSQLAALTSETHQNDPVGVQRNDPWKNRVVRLNATI